MPYVTNVAGSTITASWANASVRDQVITPFANAAARDSAITAPLEGQYADLADVDQLAVFDGFVWVPSVTRGAWTAYTPTLGQGATTNITKTVTYSKYARWGRLVVWSFDITVTGTGTAGNPIYLTLPVNFPTAANPAIGSGIVIDSSFPSTVGGSWQPDPSNAGRINFQGDQNTGRWGLAPNIPIDTNDSIRGTVTYEAAY